MNTVTKALHSFIIENEEEFSKIKSFGVIHQKLTDYLIDNNINYDEVLLNYFSKFLFYLLNENQETADYFKEKIQNYSDNNDFDLPIKPVSDIDIKFEAKQKQINQKKSKLLEQLNQLESKYDTLCDKLDLLENRLAAELNPRKSKAIENQIETVKTNIDKIINKKSKLLEQLNQLENRLVKAEQVKQQRHELKASGLKTIKSLRRLKEKEKKLNNRKALIELANKIRLK